MQEVTGNNRDSLTNTSQLEDLCLGLKDYTCIAYERNDKKYSYNAVFYRTDRYECLAHSSFWLSETPDKPSKSWGSRFYRRCVVAHMRDKYTQQEFWFANAHTDYSPLEAGLKQAQLLADTLPKIAGQLPIILVGDLNHDRYKDPNIYQTYRTTLEDQPHPYTPTYQNWHTVRDTTYTGMEIDYLLYRQMRRISWQVVTEDYGRRVPPSDHFPLYGDFQLMPKR
jgi:endonuclease/exonuclease/phosphatase family metal-dependent hydrolase